MGAFTWQAGGLGRELEVPAAVLAFTLQKLGSLHILALKLQ
jgi:hypothetical protein